MHDIEKSNTKNNISILIGKTDTFCFDPNEFFMTNFSVDEFLHKYRNASSFEQLRDDLGLYLRGLRSSLIDLINEDYADFVSLSANLVGLDQSIDKIKRPLDKMRTEIEGLQEEIKENETAMRTNLNEKRQVRQLIRDLESLKHVYATMEKLDNILSQKLHDDIKPLDLERAALELIQLKFNSRFCKKYLQAEHKEKIDKLAENVLDKLRQLFNDALKSATSTCTEKLERCLRIYITIDSCNIAEEVFRSDVVSPYMLNIISEHSLQNSPQGLAGIYSKILNFISLHMTDLLRLTLYTDKLRGFNFIVNSFWAEVVSLLETNLSSIFAPGNAEIFYSKYKCTKDLMSKIEELLAGDNAIAIFRQSPHTRSIESRWNLPVYFTICFQNIAGQFESSLEPLSDENIINKIESTYRLLPFEMAVQASQRCWKDGIFLPEVFPKFYKLNIQIIIRLSHWINNIIHLANSGNKSEFAIKLDKSNFLITLHCDLQLFVKYLSQLKDTIKNNIPIEKTINLTIKDSIDRSFIDLSQDLIQHLRTIENTLVCLLISDSGLENVRQVNDLPRLYRKTNREIPTRCSTYIEQMLRPLKTFSEQHTQKLGQDIIEQILLQVFNKITADYHVAVGDVLTSVQKTEESLRRLRNLKASSAGNTTVTNTMSDDDKIRLQLRVDVNTWTSELLKLNFQHSQIDKLTELNAIVEESIKIKENINS